MGKLRPLGFRLNSRRRFKSRFQGGLEDTHSLSLSCSQRKRVSECRCRESLAAVTRFYFISASLRYLNGDSEHARMVWLKCVGTTVPEAVRFETQKRDLKVDSGGDGKPVKLLQQLLARPLTPSAPRQVANQASQIILHSLSLVR
jgi:hypothetical protein